MVCEQELVPETPASAEAPSTSPTVDQDATLGIDLRATPMATGNTKDERRDSQEDSP